MQKTHNQNLAGRGHRQSHFDLPMRSHGRSEAEKESHLKRVVSMRLACYAKNIDKSAPHSRLAVQQPNASNPLDFCCDIDIQALPLGLRLHINFDGAA